MGRAYQYTSLEDVTKKQTHLSSSQQKQLAAVLIKYEILFDGKIGCYSHEKFDIELIDGAKPVYKPAYKFRIDTKIFSKENWMPSLSMVSSYGVVVVPGPQAHSSFQKRTNVCDG